MLLCVKLTICPNAQVRALTNTSPMSFIRACFVAIPWFFPNFYVGVLILTVNAVKDAVVERVSPILDPLTVHVVGFTR